MRRTAGNIIAVMVLYLLQTAVIPLTTRLHISPNLLLIAVVSIAFVNGETEGMIYGLAGGILMDIFYSGPLGFFMLIFLCVGFASGFFSRYYTEENTVLPLILCLLFDCIYNVYVYFFRFYSSGATNLPYYLKALILPELVLTLLFFLILYRPIMIMNRKLRIEDDKRGRKVAG